MITSHISSKRQEAATHHDEVNIQPSTSGKLSFFKIHTHINS